MSDDNEKVTKRKTPPDGDDDWMYIWDASDKSHKSWPLIRPFHAVYSNLKAIGVIFAILLVINSEKFREILRLISEMMK